MTATLANGLVLGTLCYAAVLHQVDPDGYQRSVQEDEHLEWTTFWMFVIAAISYARAALWQRRADGRQPWFLAGVALFCGFVAMEEISWGQRLLGYRPPAYFLEHNFQLELNVHNILADWLRWTVFQGVVLGYGAVLPVALQIPKLGALAARIGLRAPPMALVPAFVATGITYEVYPWSHTGEWAELMLGMSMLFAALIGLRSSREAAGARTRGSAVASIALATGLGALLGVGTTLAWWALASGDPERIEVARVELRALRVDIAGARTKTRCGIHKRLHSFVERYEQHHLRAGAFAQLKQQGLPEERADFMLDPWNSPYWIQHVCSDDRRRRAIFVYSFGPDRIRDSTDWEIVEDDLGEFISRPTPVLADD